MYESSFIQQLKRTNVSVDGDKTKERVEQLWKSAPNELKKQIEQDTGNSRASIYRIYHTGSISVKLAVSIAQRINNDPYYLTGEKDENNGYSEEIVERFLREKGYSKLLDDTAVDKPAKRKYQKRKETIPSGQATSDDKSEAENEKANPPSSDEVSITDPDTVMTSDIEDKQPPVEITEEEMTALLHALIIRARINTQASDQLEKVKHLLLY